MPWSSGETGPTPCAPTTTRRSSSPTRTGEPISSTVRALAAQQLGRRDCAKRVEAAWLGAPTLLRLLRWLGAGSPSAATLGKRARDAIRRCPRKEGRQLGLLQVLTGDVQAAAKLLARAPGLGWSSEDHPGHVLFPAFAGLLAEGTRAKLAESSSLRHDPLDMGWDDGDRAKARPKLSMPSIPELRRRIARHGLGRGDRAKARPKLSRHQSRS